MLFKSTLSKENIRNVQVSTFHYFSKIFVFPDIGSLRQLNVTESQFVFLLRWFACSWLAVAEVPIVNIDWSCSFSIWKLHRNIVSRTYWKIQLCYDLYHSDRVFLQIMKRCDHFTESMSLKPGDGFYCGSVLCHCDWQSSTECNGETESVLFCKQLHAMHWFLNVIFLLELDKFQCKAQCKSTRILQLHVWNRDWMKFRASEVGLRK